MDHSEGGRSVYAGHDGNVYQKTDSGWEQVERSGNANAQNRPGDGGPRQTVNGGQAPSGAANGSLDREQAARNRGFDGAAVSGRSQRLDRGAFGERFSGSMGGNRPSMNRSGSAPKGGGRRPRG